MGIGIRVGLVQQHCTGDQPAFRVEANLLSIAWLLHRAKYLEDHMVSRVLGVRWAILLGDPKPVLLVKPPSREWYLQHDASLPGRSSPGREEMGCGLQKEREHGTGIKALDPHPEHVWGFLFSLEGEKLPLNHRKPQD